jgi:hypothetical protein
MAAIYRDLVAGNGRTAQVHDYHDTATSVLASSLAKRAAGCTCGVSEACNPLELAGRWQPGQA